MNNYALLVRGESTVDGTFGRLQCSRENGDVFECYTLELPWKGNQRNVSCIPAGTYLAEMYSSSRFGRVYSVTPVEGRSGILIHSGNLAGDKSEGLKSDVEGCILVGLALGSLGEQRAVLNSRQALSRLHRFYEKQPFQLDIVWESSNAE